MARGINKVILIGNLGDDPDLRYTGSGTAVCNMSLATNESFTDNDGNEVQQTEWHDCVAWSRLAEVCNEYLQKGSKVYFEGKLQTRQWEDRDGNTRYSTEVKVREMMFLDSAGNKQSHGGGGPSDQRRGRREQPSQEPQGSPQGSTPSNGQGGEQTFEPDDDLPF